MHPEAVESIRSTIAEALFEHKGSITLHHLMRQILKKHQGLASIADTLLVMVEYRQIEVKGRTIVLVG